MAEAPAGAIRFDTSIDTKGIEEGVKKMQSAIADGSKKSAKNLDDVDKSAQDLGKSLKIKPEGMEKLERELDNINGQIEIQERLLDGMRASYRRLSDIGLGDSDQGLRLQKQILSAEGAIEKLIEKSDKAAAELREMDSAMEGASNASSDLGDKSGKAKEGIDGVNKSAKDSPQSISAMTVALGDLIARGIEKAISAIGELMGKTREYREDMSKLNTNAELAGVGLETTGEAMKRLNAITGETDSNVEAISNLLQAGFDDNNMLEAVNSLSGAVIKFPDTLKIESLADSLQETLATGESTGQFAELLDRLGINTEKFEKGLQRATKQGREQEYVLNTLAKSGLPEVTAAYRESNQALIESANARFEYNQALADIASAVEPIVSGLLQNFTQLWNENADTITQWTEIRAYVAYVDLSALSIIAGLPPEVLIIISTIILAISAFNKVNKAIKDSTGVIGTVSSAFRAANPTFAQTAVMVMGVVAAVSMLVFLLVALTQGVDRASHAMKELGNNSQKVKAPNLNVPGYASGTLAAPRGLAWVGEQRPELIDLRGGERIYTNAESMNMVRRANAVSQLQARGALAGSNAVSNVKNYYNVTVDAHNIKEFNDVISAVQNSPNIYSTQSMRKGYTGE